MRVLENNLELAQLEYDNAVETREKYESDSSYSDLLQSQLNIETQERIAAENAQMNIDNYKSQHAAELNSAYSEVLSELSELSAELESIQLTINYNKIYAPVSGYINEASVNIEGTVVSSGEQVFTIVPDSLPLEMKAYVTSSDIANVETGSKVRVKLDAYPYSEYGTVDGIVKSISPDTYTIDGLGNVYQLIIELDNTNENIEIVCGLSETAEIKTGQRRIISYFLEPLLNGSDTALKEE